MIVECPINSVSLGQVSMCLLRRLWELKKDVLILPIQNNMDQGAFRIEPDLQAWLNRGMQDFWARFDKSMPHIKVWHINGSATWVGEKRFLWTFHETDQTTPSELNIVKNTTKTFFTGRFSKGVFENAGATNVKSIDLGYDSVEYPNLNKANDPNTVNWLLAGKAEMRKNTYKILNLWINRYGVEEGKPFPEGKKNVLYCMIHNPFLGLNDQWRQQHENTIAQIVRGRKFINVIFIPWLNTNAEYNDVLNSCDIDLTGLSSGESWNLPAFNMTCLGKWSIVLNSSGHKSWATPDNCILVEPTGKRPVIDNIFFHPNAPFNQGNFFDIGDDKISIAFSRAELKAKTLNEEGVKLGQMLTYTKSVDYLLNQIEKDA